ncbi:single-stranded-DNA-specific exonuclease RecJ [Candidatus Nitrosacidococcus tergens]|uniref:Single-stranded-DNA-specific exonuclease RecJ n=1 Tax=Candidatus Nitrosacidococcus tergens TaxID=553981 RepID=A0A7G1QAE1_9GAMM|nr:single-stranded-DNA-specific exonuclease RecJ [Candidatus Nitrosacidococcus tergens]CAB1276481.1 Single-stranded-DNA-specific exonuclease RecJ [Candidatus Nitrosacidococcus tergens]
MDIGGRVLKQRRIVHPSKLPNTIHPVLRKVYEARNIQSINDLDYRLVHLPSPWLFSNIHAAVELLMEALTQDWQILIVADFDADGATSCAVAVRALRLMGASQVDYLVPNRFIHGYGLTPTIVAEALQGNKPDLIITVDNGIASVEGVQAAKKAGIHVLITDHHLPGKDLPNTETIINPNLPNDSFPSKCLAGVGVIFYVMLALRSHLRDQDWFNLQNRKEPNLAQLLDLVALGTVADVASLDKVNRTLVSQGLSRIQKNYSCAGIQALISCANRSFENITSMDLGFSLGPRLNAAGRLEDMRLGIECLLTDSLEEAQQYATQLNTLNYERRKIEATMQDQAAAYLEDLNFSNERNLPLGYCLFNEAWHQGVIGLLASRIKEQVYRPVIVFAPDEKPERLKGSARSIPGLHIRDALDRVATEYPALLDSFGGHAMAAGLSLKKTNFISFQESFLAVLESQLNEEHLKQVILSDGAIDNWDLNLAEAIHAGGPWGQGFPEPLFDGVFWLESFQVVGKDHLKLALSSLDRKKQLSGIIFRYAPPDWFEPNIKINLVYRLSVNVYKYFRSVQLIIEYITQV